MKKKIYKYLYWSVLWHSKNCLDGIKEYIVHENQLPVLFHTKREAKEYIKRRFGYIATRKDLRIDTEPLNAIPIKRDYRVDIEVERGLAYTHEGKKQAAKELGDYMVQLSQIGLVDPEVVKVYLRKLLEVYGFGASNEIMEAMEQYTVAGQLTEEQIQTIKIAIIEVMKDMQKAGILPTSEQRIEEGKVATAEAIRDTGLASKKPQEIIDPQEQAKKDQEMTHSDEKHQISIQGAKQKQTIEAMKAVQDMKLKDKMAKSQAKMMKGGNQNADNKNRKRSDE